MTWCLSMGAVGAHFYDPKASHFTLCGQHIERGSPWTPGHAGRVTLCEDCRAALVALPYPPTAPRFHVIAVTKTNESFRVVAEPGGPPVQIKEADFEPVKCGLANGTKK